MQKSRKKPVTTRYSEYNSQPNASQIPDLDSSWKPTPLPPQPPRPPPPPHFQLILTISTIVLLILKSLSMIGGVSVAKEKVGVEDTAITSGDSRGNQRRNTAE